MNGTRVKVPATEISNSPPIISNPTPIATIAVIGTCGRDRTARLPIDAKRNCSGYSRLQPTQVPRNSAIRMTMLMA